MDTKQSSEKRFALLIDADNVSAKYIKPITDELSKYGTVTYKRIYGDWTLTLHAKWKDALLENSITPIQQFGYTQGKNATDSAMIIDAMDILYTRSVEGFCIVSSDSDFTRLASRIRESGLTVIGMGEKKTPTPFRKACDIFTTLELLLGDTGGKGAGGRGKSRHDQSVSSGGQNAGATTMSKDEIEQAVVNIITDNQNNGKSTGLGEVGSRLLKRFPDFDVRSYGTNLLSKLLDEFASVQIIKDGSSVAVVLTEGKDAKDAPAETEPSVESQEPGAKEPRDAKDAGESKPAARRSPRRRKEQASAQQEPEAVEQPTEAVAPVEEPEALEAPAPAAEAEDAPAAQPQQRARKSRRKPSSRSARPQDEDAPASEPAPQPDEPAAGDEPAPAKRKPAARAKKPARKPAQPVEASAAQTTPSPEPAPAPEQRSEERAGETPEQFIRRIVRESGAEGVALSELGKRVRGRFRSFKLRDLGYTQLRSYVADIDDVEIEKRGKDFIARLGE